MNKNIIKKKSGGRKERTEFGQNANRLSNSTFNVTYMSFEFKFIINRHAKVL